MPRFEDMDLGRLCNFVYWYLTRDADKEGLDKFNSKLWMPPVGVEVTDNRSPWAPENEMAALANLKAALGGTDTVSGGETPS